MLTTTEQDDLYVVIASFLGEDSSIKQYKNIFSELTIKVVEDMFSAEANCNRVMKELIVGLISGGRFMSKKRWLKVSLSLISRELKAKKIHTAACRNTIKARWKSPIISSTI